MVPAPGACGGEEEGGMDLDGDRVETVSQVVVLMEKGRDRVETDRDTVETASNTVGWDEMGNSREAG
jgi:hypothetical protein